MFKLILIAFSVSIVLGIIIVALSALTAIGDYFTTKTTEACILLTPTNKKKLESDFDKFMDKGLH